MYLVKYRCARYSKTCVHTSKNIRACVTFSSNSLEYMSSFPRHICTPYISHGLHLYKRCSIPEIIKQMLFILSKTHMHNLYLSHNFIILTYPIT